MPNNLLLISDRADDQAFASEVAMAAGMTLQTVLKAQDCASMLQEETAKIILVDVSTQSLYEQLEKVVQDSVGLFSDKLSANAIHFLSAEQLENVQYLIQSPLFGHYVMRNYKDPKEAGRLYGRVVKASLAERAFGLAPLLGPNAKIQAVKLQSSTQKQQAVEAVRTYLLTANFKSRMASVIANAVDELLMNAIFDAPVDDLGRPLHAILNRNSTLKLDGKNAVEMHVGFDGEYAAITAVDLYGSLDKAKLMRHISKIYTEEEFKIKTSVAGAGIGLATVFQQGGSFFFVSDSRSRTEVTVFFKRTDNHREFKDQFRFISTQFYF